MESFHNSPALRGIKRPFEEDEDDIPDLDSLDPRNHPLVSRSEVGSLNLDDSARRNTGTVGSFVSESSTLPSQNSNSKQAGPSPSHSTETEFQSQKDDFKGSPQSTSGVETTPFTHALSATSGSSLDTPSNSYHDKDTIGDIGLTLPTTTASVLTQPRERRESSASGADSESDAEDKKLIDVETCSTSSSPNKSPKKHSGDHKDKDKKHLDDKHEDEDGGTQKSKREKQEEERLRMQVLVSNFSEDQLNRYEMFRRAAFPKAAIKRLMQSITGTSVSHNVVIAMSGISKVFVGEVVETALDVTERWGESGPLKPKHLREAVRDLKRRNSIPNTKYSKKLFR